MGDDGYRILKNGDTPAQIFSGRFFLLVHPFKIFDSEFLVNSTKTI